MGIETIGKLHPERNEITAEKKVRLFLFQSRDPKSLPQELVQETAADVEEAHKMIAELDFTNMILLRKNNASENPNQLMPIGGTIENGESEEEAIHRETVEEAHVRTSRSSTKKLRTRQTYTFNHSTKGAVQNTVNYFVGRLLPGDIPFSLNPKEDKIAGFESFTIAEYRALCDTGEITRDTESYHLLDSLEKNPEKRKKDISVQSEEVDHIHSELHTHFQLIEADKKLSVLTQLIDMRFSQAQHIGVESYRDYIDQQRLALIAVEAKREELLANGSHLSLEEYGRQVQQWYEHTVLPLWKNMTTALCISLDDIKIALHLSNTEARIRYMSEKPAHIESGIGVPSMALFFPFVTELMEMKDIEPRQRKILKQNPVTRELVRITQIIDESIANNNTSDAEITAELKKHSNFALLKDISFTPEKISSYSNMLDEYFDRLFTEAQIDESLPLRQQAAIDTTSLPQEHIIAHLMQLATGSPDVMPKNPHMNAPLTQEQYEQQVRWEAARKLILIFLLAQSDRMYQEKKGVGIAAINQKEQLVLDSMQNRITSVGGREKTLLSLFRKMIVRDSMNAEQTKDIFAETLLCTDEQDSTIQRHPVPEGIRILNAKGTEVQHISVPESIYMYVSELAKTHPPDTGTITLVEWKEPKEKMSSNSPGGGGRIRMWKWYIQHTAPDGTVQHKEVQAFAPMRIHGEDGTEHIKSAADFFNEKKADDTRYGILRLFDTDTSRSFIELLFPSTVYAEEARMIFTNVVSNKMLQKKLTQ